MLEEPPLAATDVGDLDDGAGMGLRIEVAEAALLAADLTLMPDLVTQRQRAVVERLIVPGPVRHVLHPFLTGVEKLLVHGRCVVPWLDEFDLEIAGIGQRDAHLDAGVHTAMTEPVGLDPVDVEPWPDAHHVDPVVHRGADVAHDISILTDSAKDATHVYLQCRRTAAPVVLQPIERPPSITSSVPVT